MNEVRSRLTREHPSRSFMLCARRLGPSLDVEAEHLIVSNGYLLRGGMVVRGDRIVAMSKNIAWSTEYEHS